MKYLVAQLGARRHYAIPRMLHNARLLEHLYTDICAVKGWPKLLRFVPEKFRPVGLKRLLGRVPNDVPEKNISAFTHFGLVAQRRRTASLTPTERTEVDLWAGKRFCELIIENGLRDADGVYTFNSAGLELLELARQRGIRTVMEQTIAPREIEAKLLEMEHEAYPDWEPPPLADALLTDFIERERAEWALADLILCGSEFVRDSIAACGGPVEKCRVLPFGVDNRFSSISERRAHRGPLRVLTVGGVGLRKGSPYVFGAAKALGDHAEFRMVGGHTVEPAVLVQLKATLEMTGAVPRSEMQKHFAWADVFLLPSLCEGSAMVVYEALASGLPVVCTPNTGSIVRDMVDGFIVPIRDAKAITEALMRFIKNPELLHEMGVSARTRAQDFTLACYQKRLVAALTGEESV